MSQAFGSYHTRLWLSWLRVGSGSPPSLPSCVAGTESMHKQQQQQQQHRALYQGNRIPAHPSTTSWRTSTKIASCSCRASSRAAFALFPAKMVSQQMLTTQLKHTRGREAVSGTWRACAVMGMQEGMPHRAMLALGQTVAALLVGAAAAAAGATAVGGLEVIMMQLDCAPRQLRPALPTAVVGMQRGHPPPPRCTLSSPARAWMSSACWGQSCWMQHTGLEPTNGCTCTFRTPALSWRQQERRAPCAPNKAKSASSDPPCSCPSSHLPPSQAAPHLRPPRPANATAPFLPPLPLAVPAHVAAALQTEWAPAVRRVLWQEARQVLQSRVQEDAGAAKPLQATSSSEGPLAAQGQPALHGCSVPQAGNSACTLPVLVSLLLALT
mmetsp:Transcript_2725/g.7032  ORF Transcript_2725/g.7032 Transcript_2725/m.7032 type:complete len:382 (+) Transcript_2725:1373-2518(+)